MHTNIYLFDKIKQKLTTSIEKLFNKKKDTYIEELTSILIDADLDINLIDDIIKKINKKTISNAYDLKKELYEILKKIIQPKENLIKINNVTPFIILTLGINGVGKTSTVIKLANLYKKDGKKVAVVAADTYRAAGIEQLENLCKKNNIDIIKQHTNADSAAVIFDSLVIAKNKNIDIIIIDTSGRLHTNEILMSELKKIANTIKKVISYAPNETFLVLDANFGQNIIKQFEKFNEYIKISGLILTKTDTLAKGGAIISLMLKNIPVKYICHGEDITHIKFFNYNEYLLNLLDLKKE